MDNYMDKQEFERLWTEHLQKGLARLIILGGLYYLNHC